MGDGSEGVCLDHAVMVTKGANLAARRHRPVTLRISSDYSWTLLCGTQQPFSFPLFAYLFFFAAKASQTAVKTRCEERARGASPRHFSQSLLVLLDSFYGGVSESSAENEANAAMTEP